MPLGSFDDCSLMTPKTLFYLCRHLLYTLKFESRVSGLGIKIWVKTQMTGRLALWGVFFVFCFQCMCAGLIYGF